MADEGFREIQLNGKQLVFLFMTAAVVLVVTFLCGVLVGRGVRAQKEPIVAGDGLTPGVGGGGDPTAGIAAGQPQASAASDAQPPSTPPPAPAEEDLSYSSRLQSPGKAADLAKPAVTPPPPAAKAAAAQKAGGDTAVKAASSPPPAAPAASEPAGKYALRVAAYKDRKQADTLSARLAAKGYSTYVVQLPSGRGPGLFSVRVGKFKTTKEADAVKRRLQKEEQLKPSLITP